jgi:hypothetical protein
VTTTQSLTQQFAAKYAAKAVPGMLNAIRNVKWAVRVVFGAGIAISYGHQAHYLTNLPDVGLFGWGIPGVFDVGMLAAMVVTQTVGMAEAAKSRARKVLVALVSASVAVNMLAAHTWPVRFVFAAVVALVAAMEWMAAPIAPDFQAMEQVEAAVAAPTAAAGRKMDPAVAAERAAKAAVTKEKNRLARMTPAQKREETKRRRAAEREVAAIEAELAEMQAGVVPANAPVSPAMA